MTTRRRRKDPDTITRIRGNKVTIELEDWRAVLGILRGELAGMRQELMDLGLEAADLEAAGCDDCDDACSGHGGCDFAFGEAPECGYVCEDGHIVLRGVET